jgi:hypothetical protein
MKTIAAILLALAPAVAQIHPAGVRQPVPATEAAKIAPPETGAAGGSTLVPKSLVSSDALRVLQTQFDSELAAYNYNDSIDVIGRTRGVYLNDYGVVFTTELSPIVTPNITPFIQKIPEETKVSVHKRKLERIPVVKQKMADMMKHAAEQLALLPENQQIVVVVKLLYYPYEDTSQLPKQIMMKGDKRAAQTGKFTTLEEY